MDNTEKSTISDDVAKYFALVVILGIAGKWLYDFFEKLKLDIISMSPMSRLIVSRLSSQQLSMTSMKHILMTSIPP